jgi:formylglycine-generating enzyme required for sulfatase activity
VKRTILIRWLHLIFVGCVAGAVQAAGLFLERTGSELTLIFDTPQTGRGTVYESDDLTDWRPIYSFSKSTAREAFGMGAFGETERRFFRVDLGNYAVPSELVWIPPGEFLMGSPEDEQDRVWDEGPQRTVHIRRGFWMSRYEVTVADYMEIMNTNPSSAPDGSRRPVEYVSWEEAMEYCRRRTARDLATELIPPGAAYRLPTEAEWEYACRAGTTTRFSFGDDPEYEIFREYGWGGANTSGGTKVVGTKRPNPWGLYDMHGNVFEWCLDWYGPYPDGDRLSSGKHRVYRGGAFYCPTIYLRSASRHPGDSVRSSLIGFRVVLGAEAEGLNPLLEVEPLEAHLTWSQDRTWVRVSATTPTDGAIVCYTTNNVDPIAIHPVDPPLLTAPATVKAVGFKRNYCQSPLLVIVIQQLEMPELRHEGGWLVLSAPVPGAAIEYSLDDEDWQLYSGPVQIDETTSIRARTTKPGYLTSRVAERT